MPRLTGLAPDPRLPGYRVVQVERGRFASLPAEALEILDLTLGAELAPPVLERLQELADVEAAYRAGARALAARGRARGDLRRRLLRRQHPPRAVDQALARLEAQGLLDDARFALEYAARRVARGNGPPRVLADLLSQGVARGVADAALRGALADEGADPASTLRAIAARRAAQLAPLPVPTRKRRLAAFLARRGYRGREVTDLVNGLCE